jgi:6-phosphogluconolactonase
MSYDNHNTVTDEEFVQTSVRTLAEAIKSSISDHGFCTLGLSGGSTPHPIYKTLVKEQIDWSSVTVFLVDERYTSPNDPESNQKLVKDAFGATEVQTVFPDTILPIEDCVSDYESKLRTLLSDKPIDIVTLGLGEDGHIASLFPPVTNTAFGDSLVIHTETDQFAVHDRISLTLPPLANTKSSFLFLKGEGKKAIWEEMVASEEAETRWPAKYILEQGNVRVITRW